MLDLLEACTLRWIRSACVVVRRDADVRGISRARLRRCACGHWASRLDRSLLTLVSCCERIAVSRAHRTVLRARSSQGLHAALDSIGVRRRAPRRRFAASLVPDFAVALAVRRPPLFEIHFSTMKRVSDPCGSLVSKLVPCGPRSTPLASSSAAHRGPPWTRAREGPRLFRRDVVGRLVIAIAPTGLHRLESVSQR